MNAKEAIQQIKKLIGFEEQQPEVAEQVETPVEVAPEVQEPVALAEEPQEVPAPEAEAAPDYAVQIASLMERINALESANIHLSEQLQASQKKAQDFSEALNQTVQLMEQFAAEPSAEPAQAPKDTFRKAPNADRQQKFAAAFSELQMKTK